jgi:hypothetical protein
MNYIIKATKTLNNDNVLIIIINDPFKNVVISNTNGSSSIYFCQLWGIRVSLEDNYIIEIYPHNYVPSIPILQETHYYNNMIDPLLLDRYTFCKLSQHPMSSKCGGIVNLSISDKLKKIVNEYSQIYWFLKNSTYSDMCEDVIKIIVLKLFIYT